MTFYLFFVVVKQIAEPLINNGSDDGDGKPDEGSGFILTIIFIVLLVLGLIIIYCYCFDGKSGDEVKEGAATSGNENSLSDSDVNLTVSP